jgi:MoxR-like ATPase
MLEAMAENAVTIGGERIDLPDPFMVIATQNPIEEEGTYNLPEAQMDRFLMKAVMSYPTEEEEQQILDLVSSRGKDRSDPHFAQKIDTSDVKFLRSAAKKVHVSQQVIKYAVDLVETTRGEGSKPIRGLHQLVRLGASPRASIALIRVGQASALMQGRDYVVPEDMKYFASNILRHRILLTFEALADGLTSDERILENKVLVQGVVDSVFENQNGELILVDYKTDRYDGKADPQAFLNELKERHRMQLTYYKKACEMMFEKKIHKVLVYSVPLADTVEID